MFKKYKCWIPYLLTADNTPPYQFLAPVSATRLQPKMKNEKDFSYLHVISKLKYAIL